ncbi:aldehyde dehydrogenase [Sporothrix brasiliensis 5110]|uniref:Aldehyde dehydrogenase n=1 Tax=Sporothrix brasiliensis 5110 TaxID=1398154 RepID=A0A0C2IP50_9PEZI|nr:aldehyde dehydrogenase [Sporothrix brasiliensis 5110]KIH88695.1 aldehyde dehydrogenase [Sporothrix brasiliensis 5110]
MSYPPVSEPLQLYISGQHVASESSTTFPVMNPMTGEAIYQCASASPADYATAIDAAYTAYQAWSHLGPSARRSVLLKAADIIESYLDQDAVAILSAEVSATRSWVKANMLSAAGVFRENAALATHIKGEIVPADRPGTTILVNREAVGVVLAISPWNMPVTLTARAVCCPLICGNAVLLKPSEYSPKAQFLVVRALVEAGLPPGVLQFLPTSAADAPRATAFAIAHPKVSRTNFTGGHRVGGIIASLSAKHIKKCLLELGGKAAVLVLHDADLDAAADAVAFGAMSNSGQICMSTERVIVHASVAAAFKQKLVQRVEALHVGNHLDDPTVQLSGLFCAASAKRILGLLQAAVDAGATALTGDLQVHGPNGTILAPHVMEGVSADMDLYRQETFGPVVIVNTFADEAEAVAHANQTDFTLCGSIFSRDVLRAADLAKQVRVGSCHINGPTVYVEAPLPNGGIGGASGYGRFGGMAGVEEFTERQIVSLTRPGLKYAF